MVTQAIGPEQRKGENDAYSARTGRHRCLDGDCHGTDAEASGTESRWRSIQAADVRADDAGAKNDGGSSAGWGTPRREWTVQRPVAQPGTGRSGAAARRPGALPFVVAAQVERVGDHRHRSSLDRAVRMVCAPTGGARTRPRTR